MEPRTLLATWSVLLAPFVLTTDAAETNKWETSAAAGVTLTSGNSDTFLGNLSLNSARKAERDEIFLGASGTYGTTEKETEVRLPSGRVRIAERFEHKLSDTARVWQSLEFIPEISDFDNYLIIAELGAEAVLTPKLRLRGGHSGYLRQRTGRRAQEE